MDHVDSHFFEQFQIQKQLCAIWIKLKQGETTLFILIFYEHLKNSCKIARVYLCITHCICGPAFLMCTKNLKLSKLVEIKNSPTDFKPHLTEHPTSWKKNLPISGQIYWLFLVFSLIRRLLNLWIRTHYPREKLILLIINN